MVADNTAKRTRKNGDCLIIVDRLCREEGLEVFGIAIEKL
jgi:hypothetical protein